MAGNDLYKAEFIDLTEDPDILMRTPPSKPLAVTHVEDNGFDFGRGDALPPQTRRYRTPTEITRYDDDLHRDEPIFRSLARTNDWNLLQYLSSRHISPGFLREIDMFLDGHLELADHCPDFVELYNSKAPLAAYLFFVKGYTRPARYVKGYLPTTDAELVAAIGRSAFTTMRHDDELADFFNGFDYRWDILAKVDQEARYLCTILQSGGRLSREQRTLVILALFGNPSDAYKHYEYNYQTDWLRHRYLPEHVILSEIPKPDLPGPVAHRIDWSNGHPGQMCSHRFTRARMARANDAGVDVLNVLLHDLEVEGARRGMRRWQIQAARAKAEKYLNEERRMPSGKDIVDLVMDLVVQERTRTSAHNRRVHTRGRRGGGNHIRTSKSALEGLMRHEAAMLEAFNTARACGSAGWSIHKEYSAIKDSRVRMERRLVSELIEHMRAIGKWSNSQCRDIVLQQNKAQLDALTLYRQAYPLS